MSELGLLEGLTGSALAVVRLYTGSQRTHLIADECEALRIHSLKTCPFSGKLGDIMSEKWPEYRAKEAGARALHFLNRSAWMR